MQPRFFDLSHDMLAIADTNGFLVQVNAAWTRRLGWSEQELYSRPIDTFLHPDDLEHTRAGRRQLLDGTCELVSARNRYATADGEWRWLEWRSVFDPEQQRVFGAARDVTDQVEAQRGLEVREELLTRLVTEQLQGRDAEHQHYAEVLHDSVAQHLVAALMYLETALENEQLTDAPREPVARGAEQVRASLAATRAVMQGLDPFDLGDQNLAAAVDDLRDDLARQFVMNIDVTVQLEQTPEASLANVAHRVAREGLINACRHASATSVRLDVHSGAHGIDIDVRDDGVGISDTTSGTTDATGGLGLPMMRERVRAHGGQLDIRTGADGTHLHAFLPIRRT